MSKIVTLCYPRTDHSIYLAIKKRKIGAGLYNAYGGGLEDEEDLIGCGIRETLEESTAHADPTSFEKVAIIDFFNEPDQHFECHVFFFRSWKGNFEETEEMYRAEEFPLSAVPFDKMMPADVMFLPLLCQGNKIHARVRYSQDMKEVLDFSYKPLLL